MQIRVSPGIVVVGPVLRGVVVVLISGPMKRSVGAMDLESSVQSASESFVCHHGSFQPLWPVPRKYASPTAMSRGTGPDPDREPRTKRHHRRVSRRTMPALRPLVRCSGLRPIDYPPASSRTNIASSHPSSRLPIPRASRACFQQVGCVAKTHRDAERCVIASSTHPTD